MQLDGSVHGVLKSEQGVVVSCSGRLKGEVWADRIVVNGQVEGSCHANVIEILNQGIVKGDIYCDNLSIEQGGKFLGTTHPGESQQVVMLRGKTTHTDNSESARENDELARAEAKDLVSVAANRKSVQKSAKSAF